MLGTLIVFEGINGVGKTTQAYHLARALEARGYPTVEVHCPGHTDIGKKIRGLVIEDQTYGDKFTGEFLHVADLIETTTQVILPALRAGKHVICDRYFGSTYVYAVKGLRLDEEKIMTLLDFLWDHSGIGDVPTCNILLDTEAILARERSISRNRMRNKIDRMGLEDYQRLQRGYLDFMELSESYFEWDYTLIDSTPDVPTVCDAVVGHVMHYLREAYAA